jgi:hypothetical protein
LESDVHHTVGMPDYGGVNVIAYPSFALLQSITMASCRQIHHSPLGSHVLEPAHCTGQLF